jgi:hypothetical protein
MSDAKPVGDMKILRNQREARPKLSISQYNGTVYGVRATEYGADKYARGNYHGAPPASVDPVDRFAEYIDAAQRHLGKIAQAINIAKGTGGDVRAACAVVDDEASGGFPPSMLPHIAHAIAGLKILVECGVNDGLLPLDPGQPWIRDPAYAEVLARRAAAKLGLTEALDAKLAGAGLPQKDDPDAEAKRVEDLRRRRATDQPVPEIALYGAAKPLDEAGPVWDSKAAETQRMKRDAIPPFNPYLDAPPEAVPEKIDDGLPPPVTAMSTGGLPL